MQELIADQTQKKIDREFRLTFANGMGRGEKRTFGFLLNDSFAFLTIESLSRAFLSVLGISRALRTEKSLEAKRAELVSLKHSFCKTKLRSPKIVSNPHSFVSKNQLQNDFLSLTFVTRFCKVKS